MIARRIDWHPEKNKILSKHLMEFRKGRLTVDSGAIITTDISLDFVRRHVLGALILDIDDALDVAQIPILAGELCGVVLPPNIIRIRLIMSIATDIELIISTGNETTSGWPKGACSRVPSCRLVHPIFFLLLLIKKILPTSETSITTDDCVIYFLLD